VTGGQEDDRRCTRTWHARHRCERRRRLCRGTKCARKHTQLNRAPFDEGVRDLVHQFREFLIALWLSPGGQGLAFLTIGTVLVVCATAAAQVGLNAWNRRFYEAISARNFFSFLYQLLVFAAIAGGLLVLNVAQAWLREMIKLRSREWLTRDLFAEWLKPGAPARLAGAGEIGINPDQHIHEDVRRLTELSADLGAGLLQASLLLLSFLGVLWTVSGALELSICGVSLAVLATWRGVRFSTPQAVLGSRGALVVPS
jgi:vitamin B12/bleomycin/antimicrobial peptide transport system ATP-binding/permease protein